MDSVGDSFVLMAGWEERCLAGLRSRVLGGRASSAYVFGYTEYRAFTEATVKEAKSLCEEHGIECAVTWMPLGEPAKAWQELRARLFTGGPVGGSAVTVDMSTMTRECIWIIFHLLACKGCRIEYMYNMPGEYASWLSKDPGKPRMVYKLGGICGVGKPTKLVVVSGYDVNRIRQLMLVVNPETTFIGVQTGTQFGNSEQNAKKCRKEFKHDNKVTLFDMDALGVDHGYAELREVIADIGCEANVIMTSLGIKLSAVSMYRLQREVMHAALMYAPSTSYNMKYSSGVGDEVLGWLNASADSGDGEEFKADDSPV